MNYLVVIRCRETRTIETDTVGRISLSKHIESALMGGYDILAVTII